MSELLTFPDSSAALLERYVPPDGATPPLPESSVSGPKLSSRPFVTLTFATSLDSSLSLAPGVRTRLSGPGSKAMTHYLRSRHAAILIGVSTLLADAPALNCRVTITTPTTNTTPATTATDTTTATNHATPPTSSSEPLNNAPPASVSAQLPPQPRPIIVDPHLRWTPDPTDKVLELAGRGAGLAPFVLTGVESDALPAASVALLERLGGKYIHIGATPTGPDGRLRFNWRDIFQALHREGLGSVMVEGGGQIINSLLDPAYHELIDSVIVTIAPTWLGRGGVVVSPDRLTDATGVPLPVARLSDVSWYPFGQDVVLCGRLHP